MASASQNKQPLWIGQVTHVTNPSDFWMQIGDEATLAFLQAMEQSLGSVAQQLPVVDVNTAQGGDMVLVCPTGKYKDHQSKWRRAKITRVDRQARNIYVFYIDYGGSSEMVRRVYGDVPADIHNFPSCCCRCTLAGIRPIVDGKWTKRGIQTFEELVSQGVFKVCVLRRDQDSGIFTVNLYPKVDGSSKSVAHEMLDAMTGLPTDEKVEEYWQNVIHFPFEESDCDDAGNSQTGEDEAACSEQTSAVDDDSIVSYATCDDSVTHTPDDRDAARETQKIYNEDLSDDSKEGSPDSGVTGTAAVTVPGFNLSGLQQRRMLCAEELQQETERVAKAMRRARLQKDMIEVHRNLEQQQIAAPAQGQKWGKSDLLFYYGQVGAQGLAGGSSETSGGGGDSAPGEHLEVSVHLHIASLYPQDKGLKPHLDYSPENFLEHPSVLSPQKEVTDISTGLGEEKKEGAGDQAEEPGACTAPVLAQSAGAGASAAVLMDRDSPAAVACPSFGAGATYSEPKQPLNLPPPPEPHFSWSAEEREYRTHEYIRKLLKEVQLSMQEGLDIDKAVVFSHIHCLAPPDAECEAEMKTVLEALLQEAVRDEEVRPLALDILSSYTGVLGGVLLLQLMKLSADKFVKLPVGKSRAYHIEFVNVLILLLYQSLDWPVLLKIVLQDFTWTCLEKWIIFNKKGMQLGLLHQQIEKVYVSCAELLLPVAYSMLQQPDDLTKFIFIMEQMREKVLEADVEYSIRSSLLSLLLKIPQPESLGLTTQPAHQQTLVIGTTSLTSVHTAADQRNALASQGGKDVYSRQDKGVQTEGGSELGGGGRNVHDVSIQTEGPVFQDSITSNAHSMLSGLPETPNISPVRGRRRSRRAAVLNYLSRQAGDMNNPASSGDNDLLDRSAAQVLAHNMAAQEGTGDASKQDIELVAPTVEELKNLLQVSPASTFVSAMAHVSQAAYSSVFGGGDDDPQQYDEEAYGDECLSSEDAGPDDSAQRYGDSSMHVSSSNQAFAAEAGNMESNSDNRAPITASADLMFDDISSDSDSFEDCTAEMYASASGSVHVSQDPTAEHYSFAEAQVECNDKEEISLLDYSGNKQLSYSRRVERNVQVSEMFSDEEFPALSAKQSVGKADHVGKPAGNTLSLGSIAVELLETPNEQHNDSKPSGVDQKIKIMPSFQSGQTVTSDSDQIYISDDDKSVPSDWEDHADFVASGHSTNVYSKPGYGGLVPHSGQGDVASAAFPRQSEIDGTGDYFTSQSSYVQPLNPRGAQKMPSEPAASRAAADDLRYGLPASTEDCSQPGAVPYERGDLSTMFDSGKPAKTKNRKKKFRPFQYNEPVLPQPQPQPKREMWVPRQYFCSNCREAGHIVDECPLPPKPDYY